MWGRSPRYDSDFRAGKPGSSQRHAWPRPSDGEVGEPRRGSVPNGGSQVAWGRGPTNHEEGRRRSPDRRPAPPLCPPGSAPTPSRKEALDFHGKAPPLYPHWCSLCDVTVMSEKVWLQHINGTPHADGQLQLLQRFPHWDCRLEPDSGAAPLGSGSGPAPARKADSQSERRREEGAPEQPPETTNQSSSQCCAVSRSSVVCVKFPPQAVDEVFLRRLAERFGPVVQVLMFPSLAFMELGSAQQAQDLVRFHQEEPPTVQGQQMEFRVSHTFSFPQSSRVVSFSPAPPAGGKLMALVRGFGSPLYMLVLPSAVLVEMEEATDAQKLLDHFSSDSLKIDGEAVTVTFSREFRSLTRVTGALKCQEGGGGGGSSSREQGSSNRTWSRSSTGSGSPGSQVAPAAPPAGEAEPEKDSESSAESDIEGMEVIAANLEDDDLENLEEEEEQEEVPQQEVDSPADLKNYCTTLDQLEEDTATAELHEATSASSHQPCLGRGAAADTSSSREKRPHGPEASKRSLEKEQQRRSSPRRRCGSSEESAAPEESAPPPDWSHDSPWTRSRGRAAVEEQGAAGPEETLRRRASSQNHKEPEEKKRRSSSTAEQELSHQQGATSTPELLEDSQSQQAEPAGGATEHQNPAQPVGTEFVRPVVGYFCHLCQVIFADEDEAKGQHCSSPAHYRKYQEKTGRDPWR
ncbi:uncharacterized protein LOC142882069 isoform X1 [Nelusetta ayraudi]|uniref:uncharacterized protein LOC142882069 isoform X1 n=1 Tax=Nelusetta ayraudi TaxID=303726 RepID=UPI003F6FDBA4